MYIIDIMIKYINATPPYTEGVQWLVSKKTHFINERQLKKLRDVGGIIIMRDLFKIILEEQFH